MATSHGTSMPSTMENIVHGVTDNNNNNNKTIEMCYTNDSSSVTTGKLAAYIVIFAVSFIANSLVTHAAFKDMIVRRTINRLVANICIANLLITLVYMPRMMFMVRRGSVWLVGGTAGLVLCKMVPIIHHACVLVSILSLATLSVDRFFNIVFPMKVVFTHKNVNYIILFIWILAIAVRVPTLYALNLGPTPDGTSQVCGAKMRTTFQSDIARQAYYTSLLIAFYALPLTTMIILYAIIIIYLKRKEHFQARCNVDASLEAKYRKARKSVLTMLLTVSFTFILCWMTYFVAQIAYTNVPCSLRFWRFFLAHCNCAISPCLFLVFNRGYRDVVCTALYDVCCACCTSCEIAEDSDVVQDNEGQNNDREKQDKPTPSLQLMSVPSSDHMQPNV